MDFSEKLKQLPQKPGVYLMIDSPGNIIYVGKAKNLKNRVSQYFRNQRNRSPKVAEMIHNIHTFDYRVTDTELDAFIEECRLIKEIKPKFNRQMKNTNYFYIKIPSEPYPKLAIVSEKAKDGAEYFGPFTSRHRVETAVQYLQDFYPIRKCTSPGLVNRANGCLFRQLGSCLGVCTGRISAAEYKVHIEKIRLLLNGNDMTAVRELPKLVESAIAELKFEQASQYSKYYFGLRHVIGKQQLVRSSNKNRNILAVEFINAEVAKLFCIKGNKLLYSEVCSALKKDTGELKQHLNQIIRREFGGDNNNRCGLSQDEIDEAQIIYSYLKRNKKRIISFWIPSNYVNKEISRLDNTITKIVKALVAA